MKKGIAALLASTLVLSMTACGGGESASGQAEEGDDGTYTVTLVLKGSQQPDEERIEAKINEILEKELNAKLDLVVLPWASANQQMQLMLAGDEKIDIFYNDGTTAVRYMNSGQILDMTELVDKYGKNLKEIPGLSHQELPDL